MDRLIIILNNYEEKYKNTFHNVALDFLPYFFKKSSIKFKCSKESNYILYTNNLNKNKILIPNLYMNENIHSFNEFTKNEMNKKYRVFLIFDDINVKLGSCKLNPVKGNKTHNGVKPFFEQLESFFRIRIGIREKSDYILKDYVLSKLNSLQINTLINLYVEDLFKIVTNVLENKKEEKIIEENNFQPKKVNHLVNYLTK